MFKRLFLLLLLVVLAVVASHPAAAATPLTINYVRCNSTGGDIYYPGFMCEANVSGGIGSYTYSWAGGYDVTIQEQYGPYVFGTCRAHTASTITLTLTDSTGVTTSRTTVFNCGVWADV